MNNILTILYVNWLTFQQCIEIKLRLFYLNNQDSFNLVNSKYTQFNTECQHLYSQLQNCLTFAYNYLRISFIDWMDVTGIESSTSSNVKWIVYTELGEKYRIPIRKNRGPTSVSTVDQVALSMKFGGLHKQLLGPYGDYHGQQELLKEL